MSEAEAYLRIQAAKVGRRFPLVLELLGDGGVNLTAIKLLAPHFTEDNHAHLLERVRGKKKRAVEALVAQLSPKPDVPERLRKLPTKRSPIAEVMLASQGAHAAAKPPFDARVAVTSGARFACCARCCGDITDAGSCSVIIIIIIDARATVRSVARGARCA